MISQLTYSMSSIPHQIPPPSRSSIQASIHIHHPAGLLPSIPAYLILGLVVVGPRQLDARHPKQTPLPPDASAALEHHPPKEIERARFSSTPTPLGHVACETKGPGPPS